jgi:hypothetical protein
LSLVNREGRGEEEEGEGEGRRRLVLSASNDTNITTSL